MLSKLAILCLVQICFSQIPIPKRPLGFVYNLGHADAPVNFDVFMGPLCPDSAAALPNIQKVADYYGASNLRLKIHLFPLPYHRNSFLASMGIQSVDEITKGNSTYAMAQTIYMNLNTFADETLTQAAILGKMAQLANGMGISQASFLKLASDERVNEDRRVAWKYAASRSVTGTPTFMLNGVTVAADPAWTVSEWNKVIDPLIKSARMITDKADCKVGTKRCEFLPGKVECCTKGEACIPNVGCRC